VPSATPSPTATIPPTPAPVDTDTEDEGGPSVLCIGGVIALILVLIFVAAGWLRRRQVSRTG
jgi:hypothetical protein